MDLLEQPLEAVALHLYSIPEVAVAGAAAWTCLAAVVAAAAAAGLWRRRSSTPSDVTDAGKPLELDPSPLLTSTEPERSSERSPSSAESTSSPAPSPRERYTAYYYDSACIGCCDVEADEEDVEDEDEQDQEDDDGVYRPAETDPFEWEVVRSLPLYGATAAAGTTGPYRSPRSLSGSVVRLWDHGTDGGLTAAASPRRRGGVGTVSAF